MAKADKFLRQVRYKPSAGTQVFEPTPDTGFAFAPFTSAPTPGAGFRGMPYIIEGGTGVADVVAVPMKNAADAYVARYPVYSSANNDGRILVYQSAAFTLPNDNALNACFTAAQDTVTVQAATTYLVNGFINLTTGATTHTTAFSLKGAGATTTATSVNLFVVASSNATGGGLAAAQCSTIKVLTAQAVTATSTAVDTHIRISGSVQINAGGTLIPSIQFSADPTGTCQTNIGSFLELIPIGSNTLTSIGPWA